MCEKKSKLVLCDPCFICAQRAQIEYLLSERDAVDWVIRQLRSEKVITMEQMIIILRCWRRIIDDKRGKRLTTRELRKVLKK